MLGVAVPVPVQFSDPGRDLFATLIGHTLGDLGRPRRQRVFVLDSHDIFRTGVRSVLESKEHIEVVGESASIEHGVQQVVESGPHVLLLGVRGSEGASLHHLTRLEHARPDVAVVVLSRALDQGAARSLETRSAVRGHLSKDVTVEELLAAIDTAAAGEYVDGTHHEHVGAPVRVPDQHGPIGRLTRQEVRILSLIAAGMSNQQIAEELYLVEKTVRNHVTRILAKLGVERRTQAALMAVKSGLVHH